jgi:hypothetical protein
MPIKTLAIQIRVFCAAMSLGYISLVCILRIRQPKCSTDNGISQRMAGCRVAASGGAPAAVPMSSFISR